MKFFENGEGLTEPRGFFCSGARDFVDIRCCSAALRP